MSQFERKLHLNVFLYGSGHHEASWRHPGTHPERNLDIRYSQHLAQTAERGLMDSVFLADGYAGRSDKLEPFTQLAALAMVTERIGLIATVGTTYNESFHVAREFASLDHISNGRAGWNIVTGAQSAAFNFSRIIRQALKNSAPILSPTTPEFAQAHQEQADFLYSAGAINKKLDTSKVLDNSYVEQALKELSVKQ